MAWEALSAGSWYVPRPRRPRRQRRKKRRRAASTILLPEVECPPAIAKALYKLARQAGARVNLDNDGNMFFDMRVLWGRVSASDFLTGLKMIDAREPLKVDDAV